MIVKQDKCLNCGASIDYSKIKDRTYQCSYCREFYHIDEYGMIEEYKIKINWQGKDIYCYLSSVHCDYPIPETYRNLDGKIYTTKISQEPILTFELQSYRIEDNKIKKIERS